MLLLYIYRLFDDYGVENCRILQLEAYPCQTREELNTREGYYIKNTECVNKNVAGRTTKEYRQDNKTEIEKQYQEWKNNNKEHVKKYKKTYYEEHKEKSKVCNKSNYQRNKEQLLEQHLCDCGKYYTYCHQKRHEKSQYHQNYLNQLKQKPEPEQEPKEKEKPLEAQMHKLKPLIP
eukprot:Skav210288  [mRNA]  locus=scaffold475:16106:16633:+ [translate_table: standard]